MELLYYICRHRIVIIQEKAIVRYSLMANTFIANLLVSVIHSVIFKQSTLDY